MWTEGGKIGLAPAAAMLGDKICPLLGGQVLYVLRERGEGKWEFVGECYVHGLMDGEALGLGQEYKERVEEFILKSNRFIDGKSIYWRLTICRMTRCMRVKCKNRGKVSKVRDLFPLPFGDTGDAEPAFSDTLSIS